MFQGRCTSRTLLHYKIKRCTSNRLQVLPLSRYRIECGETGAVSVQPTLCGVRSRSPATGAPFSASKRPPSPRQLSPECRCPWCTSNSLWAHLVSPVYRRFSCPDSCGVMGSLHASPSSAAQPLPFYISRMTSWRTKWMGLCPVQTTIPRNRCSYSSLMVLFCRLRQE